MWLSASNLRKLMRMHPKPEPLTQKQRVLRQYKQVLYLLSVHASAWREFYYHDYAEARLRFEQNRHINDPEEIERLLQFGDLWLKKNPHPQMYRIPYTEDGSKHQRNEAVPDELLDDSRCVDHEMLQMEFSEWNNEYDNNIIDQWTSWKHEL